nr:putative pyridoxal kinase [Tanacetum cinerariifolium]
MSLQFLNHTEYLTFKGQDLNGKQLWGLIEGLEANNLLYYTHLFTERVEVYYECMEPFKSLMCLWVRNKSIVAIWLEEVVTPLIEPAIKGFAAASAVLKPERLKVDKHDMSELMSYYIIN